MKHLKLFKTAQDKEVWQNGDNYITPNVIYINESDTIEFNPNAQLLSLHTFTAYPEVANKIMNIVNKYCSNYEDVSIMYIIIDANYNYEGINYVPGLVSIGFTNSPDWVDFNLSTEDLNYLQSISFIDTDGNVHKPHEMSIDISSKHVIDFNIYKGNTNIDDFSILIRIFEMYLEDAYGGYGYITDSGYTDPNDPNAPSPA